MIHIYFFYTFSQCVASSLIRSAEKKEKKKKKEGNNHREKWEGGKNTIPMITK